MKQLVLALLLLLVSPAFARDLSVEIDSASVHRGDSAGFSVTATSESFLSLFAPDGSLYKQSIVEKGRVVVPIVQTAPLGTWTATVTLRNPPSGHGVSEAITFPVVE